MSNFAGGIQSLGIAPKRYLIPNHSPLFSLAISYSLALSDLIGFNRVYGTEDGRSMSVISLHRQLSQGRMADFPVFVASKSFDL
jgi:hypothetical protein